MKKNFKHFAFLCLVMNLFIMNCSSQNTPSGGSASKLPSGSTGTIGTEGISGWDNLSSSEKKSVTTFQSFFLHQSVGQDLEDGAGSLGFKFEYANIESTKLSQGLNGGLFNASNGDPDAKIAEFRSMALANKGNVRVAIMKFGYADIMEDKLSLAKTKYQSAVADIKANGIKVLHITPPLVYNLPSDNSPKMQMRTWMTETFKDDVIFDLQGLESTEPSSQKRCEREGFWEICDSIRSTNTCPSLGQGADAPTGQGHICQTQAQRLAKAFLYSIYLTGK